MSHVRKEESRVILVCLRVYRIHVPGFASFSGGVGEPPRDFEADHYCSGRGFHLGESAPECKRLLNLDNVDSYSHIYTATYSTVTAAFLHVRT